MLPVCPSSPAAQPPVLFTLPIEPVPASRPQVPRFGKPYYTGAYKSWRSLAGECIGRLALPKVPAGMLLGVGLVFYMKAPKTLTALVPKADLDNLAKAVFDALVSAGVVADDRYIVCENSGKVWSERPRIEMELRHIGVAEWVAMNAGELSPRQLKQLQKVAGIR